MDRDEGQMSVAYFTDICENTSNFFWNYHLLIDKILFWSYNRIWSVFITLKSDARLFIRFTQNVLYFLRFADRTIKNLSKG